MQVLGEIWAWVNHGKSSFLNVTGYSRSATRILSYMPRSRLDEAKVPLNVHYPVSFPIGNGCCFHMTRTNNNAYVKIFFYFNDSLTNTCWYSWNVYLLSVQEVLLICQYRSFKKTEEMFILHWSFLDLNLNSWNCIECNYAYRQYLRYSLNKSLFKGYFNIFSNYVCFSSSVNLFSFMHYGCNQFTLI